MDDSFFKREIPRPCDCLRLSNPLPIPSILTSRVVKGYPARFFYIQPKLHAWLSRFSGGARRVNGTPLSISRCRSLQGFIPIGARYGKLADESPSGCGKVRRAPTSHLVFFQIDRKKKTEFRSIFIRCVVGFGATSLPSYGRRRRTKLTERRRSTSTPRESCGYVINRPNLKKRPPIKKNVSLAGKDNVTNKEQAT